VRLELGEFLPGFHTYEDYRQTYPAHRHMGGGVILSQIHELDVAYWLFGMPRKVFALGGHWSSLEIDAEDTASLLFECESAGRPLPVHIQLDFVQHPPRRIYEIVGDRGTIIIDVLASVIRVVRADTGQVDERTFEALQRNHLFLNELRHFLDCLAGAQRPVVSVRDGVQSLRMALAARQSIDAGTVVPL
jgi:predicted dehydrogenase